MQSADVKLKKYYIINISPSFNKMQFYIHRQRNKLTTNGQETSCRQPYTDPNKINMFYFINKIIQKYK